MNYFWPEHNLIKSFPLCFFLYFNRSILDKYNQTVCSESVYDMCTKNLQSVAAELTGSREGGHTVLHPLYFQVIEKVRKLAIETDS